MSVRSFSVGRASIPSEQGVRVVGDVHGDLNAFSRAVATDLFVLQLGDLVDYGPDSAGVLRLMFELIDAGRGAFLLGNHDLRLARTLSGKPMRPDVALEQTLAQLDPAMRARALAEIQRAPAWLHWRGDLFVHGGFHGAMVDNPSPPIAPLDRLEPPVARALYGQPTGRTQPDGYPERSLRWVDHIPAGMTVYCGHDRRSADGRPYRRQNRQGGQAVFLDTGAGKGGHLSWIDLP